MTKNGFKKGLLIFKSTGLKAAPDIRADELEEMYNLWNQILKNPDDKTFYNACIKYSETERFFPAVSQIKNIIFGRNPNENKSDYPSPDPRTQQTFEG
jgi:hypothetical protein